MNFMDFGRDVLRWFLILYFNCIFLVKKMFFQKHYTLKYLLWHHCFLPIIYRVSASIGASMYQKCHMKKHAQDLKENVLFEFKCMKYVEFCLSHPGILRTKFDFNVLCIFSQVAFFVLFSIGVDTLYVYISNLHMCAILWIPSRINTSYVSINNCTV